MKNLLLRSSLALLALCSALALRAAAAPAGELPLHQVAARIHTNGETVTPGTTRLMVSLRLGSPNTVLADGSWLYSGYTARHGEHDSGRSSTLVVRFADDKVATLSLASEATVLALRTAPRQPAKQQFVTAQQRR